MLMNACDAVPKCGKREAAASPFSSQILRPDKLKIQNIIGTICIQLYNIEQLQFFHLYLNNMVLYSI